MPATPSCPAEVRATKSCLDEWRVTHADFRQLIARVAMLAHDYARLTRLLRETPKVSSTIGGRLSSLTLTGAHLLQGGQRSRLLSTGRALSTSSTSVRPLARREFLASSRLSLEKVLVNLQVRSTVEHYICSCSVTEVLRFESTKTELDSDGA